MDEELMKESNDKGNVKKEGDIMSTIKPIQATPTLSGNDAINLIKQITQKPSTEALKKNSMLRNMLSEIRK